MRKKTLQTLLAGKFVCPVAFAEEYEDLADESARDEVSRWLEPLALRLARVGDAGAFYVAPDMVGADDVRAVRQQMREYRDIFGPAILAMDLIRQSDPDSVTLEPGEYLQAGQLETAINTNPALETHLNSLAGLVRRMVLKNSIRDRLEAVLQHLTDDGFLVEKDRARATYQVTGRIEHLWAVISFLEQHEPIAPQAVPDPEQDDLVLGQQDDDGMATPDRAAP